MTEREENEVKYSQEMSLAIVIYLASMYKLTTFSLYHRFFTGDSRVKDFIEKNKEFLNGAPFKHFDSVSREMEVVYRVSIFDAFLSSLTRLAVVKNPQKALKGFQIHASELLGKSRMDIINSYIEKKSRALSFGSFGERIERLQGIIDVKFDIPKHDREEIKKISKLRNEIIHEWGSQIYMMDEDLTVKQIIASRSQEIPSDLDYDTMHRSVANIWEKFAVDFMKVKPSPTDIVAIRALRGSPSPTT